MSAPATSSSTPSPIASNSLYVGDLHPDVAESRLFEIFNSVGPVASVRVCRDVATRRSLGYAYVNFHTQEDAARALENLNNTKINGKPCRIMWSQRDPSARKSGVGNVFIKKLHESITCQTLYDTFIAIGNILSCKVALHENGKSKGYGFVHFETEEAAQKAIQMVNDNFLAGQRVFVGPFIPRKDRVGNNVNAPKFTNVFVKNLDDDTTTESLENYFKKFGPISSATVVSSDGKSKCFGFINFANHEQAATAIAETNGKPIKEGGKNIYAGRAQKKAERENELKRKYEQIKQERAQKFVGCNLYIKNLPDDITDEKLRAEFAPYGTITSAKVMTDDRTGNSKGFGFVCFSSPEDAGKAQDAMHNKRIGTYPKPLYVAFAQRKETRRLQLETFFGRRPKNPAPMGPGMYPYLPFPAAQQFIYPVVPGGNRGRAPVYPYASVGGYQHHPASGSVPRAQNQQARGGGQGRSQANTRRGGQPARRDQHQSVVDTQTLRNKISHNPTEELNLVGEALYPIVEKADAGLAGKITGMLLERYSYNYNDLITLMENVEDLNQKIEEARDVLKKHNSA